MTSLCVTSEYLRKHFCLKNVNWLVLEMCNAFRRFLLFLWLLFFSSLSFSFICQYIDARPLLCQTRLGIVHSESVVEVMWITGCMIQTEKNKTRRKTKKWSVSLRGQNHWAGDSAVWHHAAMFIYCEIILKLPHFISSGVIHNFAWCL